MEKILKTTTTSLVDEIGKWMSEPHPLNLKASFELNGYTDKEADELLILSEPFLLLLQQVLNKESISQLKENKAQYFLNAENLYLKGSTEKIRIFAGAMLGELQKIQ